MKLMEHLSECDKDELEEMGQNLGVTLPPKESAKKWRERIAKTLLTPKMVAARLATLSDSEMALFERACEGMFIPKSSELDDCFAVQQSLCAFPYEEDKDPLDIFRLLEEFDRNPNGDAGLKLAEGFKKLGDFWLSVPEEIVPIYREINTPKFQELRHVSSWLIRCLAICGEFYAVTPVSILARVYACKEPISEDKLRQLLPLVSGGADNWVWVYQSDRDRVLRRDMEEQEIQSILDRQGNRDFYIPQADEIESMWKDEYPLTIPAYENLQIFLEQYCDMDVMEAREAVNELWEMLAQDDGSLQEGLQWMIDTTDAGPKFLPLLVTLYRNCKKSTRCISLRGYTLAEVSSPADENIVQVKEMELQFDMKPRKINIGRNDPCPCGSGAKYKKCCGRAR